MISAFVKRLFTKMTILHFSYLSWQTHESFITPWLIVSLYLSFSILFISVCF